MLPTKPSKKNDTQNHGLNGFDFNNYLKRKICATIEESIGGPTKKKRPSRARKKNNGDTMHNDLSSPLLQPQNNILMTYNATQTTTQPFVTPQPTNNILEYLLENKHNKLLDSSGGGDIDKTKNFANEIFPVEQFQAPLPPVVPSIEMLSTAFPMLQNASLPMILPPPPNPIPAPEMTVSTEPSSSSATIPTQSRRKIFQCSSCNKFFENWNLFLHMRQIHKKHICLHCLRHFVSAEKLLAHLETKHSLTKKYYNDQQDILNSYKNMYNSELYLMCVECEHVFNETDEFTHHLCTDYLEPCSVCGLRQKCDHNSKSTTSNLTKGQKTNRRRAPPKKNNNVSNEVVPPLIIAKTPDRKSLQTIPSTLTPASGGELKMKFKFSRTDCSKNSPCKITVESPLLQSGDVRMNGGKTTETTPNKKGEKVFEI